MNNVQYRPSGLMCNNCDHKVSDCSHLDFSKMKVIKIDSEGTKVVKCSSFSNDGDVPNILEKVDK